MKKRRMRLMALLLTLVVSFTSVVPAGATALGSESVSGAEVTTAPPSNQNEVGDTENGEGALGSTDGTQVKDDSLLGADEGNNSIGQDNSTEGTDSDDSGNIQTGSTAGDNTELDSTEGGNIEGGNIEGGNADPGNTEDVNEGNKDDSQLQSVQEVQDANWTLEETLDTEGKTTALIFRKYADATTMAELEDKWVYSPAAAAWSRYSSDAPDAAAEKLEEGIYQVGAMKFDTAEGQDMILDLTYWLDAKGNGKPGWKLSDDASQFFYFYKGDEEELALDADSEEGTDVNFFKGLRKPAERMETGYYADIDGASYWLEEKGIIAKEVWKAYKDEAGTDYFYYFGKDGKQDKTKKGLQTIKTDSGEFKYYLKDDLSLLKNDSVMVGDRKYFFDENGKYVKDYKPVKEGWMENSRGRWYQYEDGTYPENCWREIDGSKYYFGRYGYMKTDWLKLEGKWYYLGRAKDGALKYYWQKIGRSWYYLTPGTGVMLEDWQKIWGKWYYLKPGSGAMAEGWLKLGTKWFYLKPGSGAMTEDWQKIGRSWYYLRPITGTMAEGWQKIGTKWFYLKQGGAMAEGWQKIGRSWYYLRPITGTMAEGWQKIGQYWYYLTPGMGSMKTGWYKINNTWYYSYSSGAMAANTWVGNYYLTGSGAMATSRWVGNKYVGKDGKYIPGYGSVNVDADGKWVWKNGAYYFLKGNGEYVKDEKIAWGKKWYYLDEDGVMVTGWHYVDGYKLYFNSSGALIQDVSNRVSGPYRVRVNRTKCVITVLARDGGNGYTIPVKSMTCSVGLPATPTPKGTYYIQEQDRWHELMGPSWGQYTSHVVNGIFIHSVAGVQKSIYNLSSADYNMLGRPASHGCIRLCVRDAKWIYTNCSRGTQVQIGDGYYEPFDKPATIKLSTGNGLKDPTQC